MNKIFLLWGLILIPFTAYNIPYSNYSMVSLIMIVINSLGIGIALGEDVGEKELYLLKKKIGV